MVPPATFRFDYVQGIFVGVHGTAAPDAAGWKAHCERLGAAKFETRGVIVFTLGGGPDSKQREQLRLATEGAPVPPVAILTPSALVRGIITSLNWFMGGQAIAAFAPSDLEGALVFLAARGHVPDRKAIVGALRGCAAEVKVALPATFTEA